MRQLYPMAAGSIAHDALPQLTPGPERGTPPAVDARRLEY